MSNHTDIFDVPDGVGQTIPETPYYQIYHDNSHKLPGETVHYRHVSISAEGDVARAARLARLGLLVVLDWAPVPSDTRDIDVALGFAEVPPCTMLWPDLERPASAANSQVFLKFGRPTDAATAVEKLARAKGMAGAVRGRLAVPGDFVLQDTRDTLRSIYTAGSTDENANSQRPRRVVVNRKGSPILREKVEGNPMAPTVNQRLSDNADPDEDPDEDSDEDSDENSDEDSDDDSDDSDDESDWDRFRIPDESVRNDPVSRVLFPKATSAARTKGFTPEPARGERQLTEFTVTPVNFTSPPAYVPSSPVYVPGSPVLNPDSPIYIPASPLFISGGSPVDSPAAHDIVPSSPVTAWVSPEPKDAQKDPQDDHQEKPRTCASPAPSPTESHDYFWEEYEDQSRQFRKTYFPDLDDLNDVIP